MSRTIPTTLIVKITANTILASSYEGITRNIKPGSCFGHVSPLHLNQLTSSSNTGDYQPLCTVLVCTILAIFNGNEGTRSV